MRKLTDVYEGAAVYRRLVRKRPDAFFLLLTDEDEELNYYAVRQLQRCIELKGYKSAEIVCREKLFDEVDRLCQGQFPIHKLSDKQTRKLISYIQMKYTAGYIPLLSDIRLISLYEIGMGIDMLHDLGFYDKEYLVWRKMMFLRREYGDLVRTVPFVKH